MKHYRVRFEWGESALTPEEKKDAFEALRPVLLGDEGNTIPDKETLHYYYTKYVVDLDTIFDVLPKGLQVVVISNHTYSYSLDVLARLSAIEEKLSGNNKPVEQQHRYNTKVNVHVPGLGMLVLNEVKIQENCCTDQLQRDLNDGWRIIAACPQPDQRRPDYVLGRVNKEQE